MTNAHVVWPYDKVDIIFPDGEEFRGVEVIGWDLLTDPRVLGPVDAPAGPLEFVDGEDIEIGSEMYLIGYPGGGEELEPQPAIVRGILSRLREWKTVGFTYFQIDATAVGGQSGGALLSETGDVIGITASESPMGTLGSWLRQPTTCRASGSSSPARTRPVSATAGFRKEGGNASMN